ncbi:MAG: HXXEE domain-containing protein [Cyanobacteria bacterium J06635_10]
MNNSRITFASICLLFFMLWAPLGQYDFLIENWMKIGIYVAPFILFIFFSSRTEQTEAVFSDTKLISVLLLVAYMIHQFEEHWVDLFGNQYAFYEYFNTLFLSILGAQNSSVIILSQEAIFLINTSLVWLIGIIAIWRTPKHLFPVLAMNGIVLVNAISHILPGIFKQSYNPGLLTAIVIFLPMAYAFYRKVLFTNPGAKSQIIASIVWAIFAQAILITGLLLANWFELIPEKVYFAVLILWSVIPAFLFNNYSPNSSTLAEDDLTA